MKQAIDFYRDWVGKGEDIDHTAGVQCVDGWKIFLRWCGFKNYNEMGYAPSGWADSIWTRPNAQVLKYFTKITDYRQLQDGDWVVWGKNPRCFPKSHIAMYYQGQCFGLNQGSKVFTLKLPNVMNYMIGAFRLNAWVSKWVGKKYLDNGAYVTGEKYIDGHWYCFSPKTKEYLTGFVKLPTKTVYYNSKGQMLYGQQYINKKWYCFDKQTGAMMTGVIRLSTAYNSSGAKNVVYKNNGEMIHGQDTYDGTVYLCDKQTGAVECSWNGKELKSWSR